MGLYGAIQDPIGPYGTLQDYTGQWGTMQNHMGPGNPCRTLQPMRDDLGPLAKIGADAPLFATSTEL